MLIGFVRGEDSEKGWFDCHNRQIIYLNPILLSGVDIELIYPVLITFSAWAVLIPLAIDLFIFVP